MPHMASLYTCHGPAMRASSGPALFECHHSDIMVFPSDVILLILTLPFHSNVTRLFHPIATDLR